MNNPICSSITVKTPFRISFFGGGTDYPEYFLEKGGTVLSTSIDKYCTVTCRSSNSLAQEMQYPAVKAILEWANLNHGIEIDHEKDLPTQSGMGSSSAFIVSLMHCIYQMKNQTVTKEQLAQDAIHMEQKIIKDCVGSQDQIACAYGGFNHIQFNPDSTIDVQPLALSTKRLLELQSHLMLFFTGVTRIASDLAQVQVSNIKNQYQQLAVMKTMVNQAIEILQNPAVPIEEFGKLLHQSWCYKRKLTDKISTPLIDQMLELALDAGAAGGKILGAGGGGFLLLFVKPELQPKILKLLPQLVQFPFKFETLGSHVVM